MSHYIERREAVCRAIRLLMHEATVDPRILDLPMVIVEAIVADSFDEADAVTALRAEVKKPGTWRKAKDEEQAMWKARYEADQKAKAEAGEPSTPLGVQVDTNGQPFPEEQAAE